ncbi:hypothetical protein [Crateriforma conspicua]|uniref:hypothetical protein n=1 Tax=Crateriforma conspicua TaxID=2527996 RepID=UPI00118CCA8D|nr:hypothetical protein [Crateriforma conspicua]QDV61639.1 hypothetical protein Mal65_07660 [Crateriforma conspicua]
MLRWPPHSSGSVFCGLILFATSLVISPPSAGATDAIVWHRSLETAKSQLSSISGDTAPLFLIAVTNDIDTPVETQPSFWCRQWLDRRVAGVLSERPDLGPRVGAVHWAAGLPPELTGKSDFNRPERLVLAVADAEGRLLSFCVGIPTRDALWDMIEDAEEVAAMQTNAAVRQGHWRRDVAQRSLQRVNRYYAARLRRVMQTLKLVNQVDPDPAALEQVDAPEESGALPEDGLGEDALDKSTLDQDLPKAEQASQPPETNAANAIETVLPSREEEGEWEDPQVDEKWTEKLDAAAKIQIAGDAGLDASDQVDWGLRLNLVHDVFTSLYRLDAFSRFADSEIRRDDPDFYRATLGQLEQHAETRDDWVQCALPLLVGLPLRDRWEPLVELVWQQPVVRFEPMTAELEAWWSKHRSVTPVVLRTQRLAIAGASARHDVSAAGPPGRVTWADLENTLQQFPVREVSHSQWWAIHRNEGWAAVDLFRPTTISDTIVMPKSNRPMLFRQGESPARNIAKLRRLQRAAGKTNDP